LRQAQEMAHIGNWRYDLATRSVSGSDEVFQIFGLDPVPAELRAFAAVVHPHDRQEFLAAVRKGIEEGRRWDGELRLVRDGQGSKIVRVVGEPVPSSDGSVEVMVGTVQDITEIKAAEAALREREAMIRALVETSKDWIWAIDLNGVHTYSNLALESILGYRPSELVGTSSLELMHEQDRQKIAELLPAWIEKKQGWQGLLLRWRHKNGEWRFLESNAVPIIDQTGNVVGFRGVDRDITERRQAEQRLRESELRFRTVVEQGADAFFLYDLDRNIVDVNQRACESLGYDREELLSMQLGQVAAVDTSQAAVEAVKRQLEEGRTLTLEGVHRRKDGSTFPVEVRVCMLEVEGRAFTQVLARDISERVHLEEQLRQAQKLEAVGRLAGGVAHDFNNLLQVILGFGTMVKEKLAADSPVQDDLAKVLQAGRRAISLVQQLLTFSRRQVLKLENLDLGVLVRDLTKMVVRVIGEDITMTLRTAPDLAEVRGDAGQLEQMLMNLCVNARDAMPRGGEVTLGLENVSLDQEFCEAYSWASPGDYVLLRVADTGCGMDEEILSQIFEPFFTTKEKGKGTGLGLATAYGIIRQHNGVVQVESAPGRGTTFNIYLPAAQKQSATQASHQNTAVVGGTETILFAEDEQIVRDLVEGFLREAGYEVLCAADGEEALEIFSNRADAVDLVILDVVMPKLGGHDSFKRLVELRPGVKVLFISGYSQDSMHMEFVKQDQVRFVQKPFRRSELLSSVRELLDQRSVSESGPADAEASRRSGAVAAEEH